MYELYYEKEGISKELYEWLLKNGYADAQLIAKWKREGYEKVCSSILIPLMLLDANIVIAMLPPLHPNERNEL